MVTKYLNSFSGYGNVTDFYNKENGLRPEKAKYFCTIHDYFVMHLTGLTKPVIKAHGNCKAKNIASAVTQAISYSKSNLIQKVSESMK